MDIQFTPEALSDLERLREFIAQKNSLAARRMVIELQEGIEKLKLLPKIGLPVHNAPDPDLIRDLYIGNYTIRYLVAEYSLIILRVWHNKEAEKDT